MIAASPPRQRRGRPYRISGQAPERPGWQQHNRVGWLLRANRLYGANDRWQLGKTFADAFQGGCWPERTSVYQISRWETAKVRVPYLAVRRYEELLDLPANHLVAVVDSIFRYSAPAAGSAPLLDRRLGDDPSPGRDRVDELVERARSYDVMSGSDWDELTAYLAAAPKQLMSPRSAWNDITERLLTEMIISDGVAWMQRYEALNRLLAHPVGQQHAIAACASLAADRTNQIFVEVVSVLDASPHPDASRHVIDLLANPPNDRAQYGALLACVRKLRYGHFDQAQLRQLVPIVNELTLDPARLDDAQPLAAQLLRHLPPDMSAPVRSRLRFAAASGEAARTVSTHATDAETNLIARITNTVIATVPRDVPQFHDEILAVLVRELLFDRVFDVRLNAAILLLATPYRASLAATLGQELTAFATRGNPDVARTLIEALRVLGGREQRPMIERLTTATGIHPAIIVTAAWAIGHVGGYSDDRYWKAAIRHHADRWHTTRDTTHVSALNGLVYGLGVTHNSHVLRQLRDDPLAPTPTRTAASWWINLPRHVFDSVNHWIGRSSGR